MLSVEVVAHVIVRIKRTSSGSTLKDSLPFSTGTKTWCMVLVHELALCSVNAFNGMLLRWYSRSEPACGKHWARKGYPALGCQGLAAEKQGLQILCGSIEMS